MYRCFIHIVVFFTVFVMEDNSFSQLIDLSEKSEHYLQKTSSNIIKNSKQKFMWLNPEDGNDNSFILVVQSDVDPSKAVTDSFTLHYSFDLPDQTFFLINDSLIISSDKYISDLPVSQLDPYNYEFKTTAGTYSLFVPYGDSPVDTFILRNNIEIISDSTQHFSLTDANRRVTFNPVDENGIPLQVSNINSCYRLFIINKRFTYGNTFLSGIYPGNSIMISDFNGTSFIVSAHTYITDSSVPVITKIHLPLLNYLSSDTVLTNMPQDFVEQWIKVKFPPASSDRKVALYDFSSQSSFLGGYGLFRQKNYNLSQNEWLGKVVINNELFDKYINGLDIEFGYNSIIYPVNYFPLRVFDGKIAGYYGQYPSPNTYISNAGDTLIYGSGPIFANGLQLNNASGNYSIDVRSHFFGAFNQRISPEDFHSQLTINNSNGDTLYSGALSDFQEITVQPEWYQTKIVNNDYFIKDQQGSAEQISCFDLRSTDTSPPVLTSLRVLNQEGKLSEEFQNDEDITIQFSAADFILQDTMTNGYTWKYLRYKKILADSSKVLIKKSSENEWENVPFETVTEDSVIKKTLSSSGIQYSDIDAFYYLPAGIVYQVRPDSLSSWENEGMDLMIMLKDDADNKFQYIIKPVALIMNRVSDISQGNETIGSNFILCQNFPNPFNPSTTINFTLRKSEHVQIKVYDQLGRLIKKLIDENMGMGNNSVVWDGRNDAGDPVSSGIYFYTLKAGNNEMLTKKMIVIK